ncbi:unnamed protein product [Rangifer tarandus platyrhynchus]|uniref:Uncharacterized protein n=2 Tax=Rangifer tarandus platyrhynchus TaxID=3082113 RepID=A0AC59ZKZ4_RANTA|nr:unnamed protein product [Rangifer tarandus platyrhynchus]
MALKLGIHVLCKLQRLVHLEAFGEGGPQSGRGRGGGPKEVWAGTKRHLKGQKAGSTRSECCPFVMNDNNHHPVGWTGALCLSPAPLGCHVVQLLSQVQLCSAMDCSTPGFPVLHYGILNGR